MLYYDGQAQVLEAKILSVSFLSLGVALGWGIYVAWISFTWSAGFTPVVGMED